MKNFNNIANFEYELKISKKVDIDEFIKMFCEINKVSLDEINDHSKYHLSIRHLKHKTSYISICRNVLYFMIRHKFNYTFDKIAFIINNEKPVKRPTVFYYIKSCQDLITTKNIVAVDIYNKTMCDYQAIIFETENKKSQLI